MSCLLAQVDGVPGALLNALKTLSRLATCAEWDRSCVTGVNTEGQTHPLAGPPLCTAPRAPERASAPSVRPIRRGVVQRPALSLHAVPLHRGRVPRDTAVLLSFSRAGMCLRETRVQLRDILWSPACLPGTVLAARPPGEREGGVLERPPM